LHTNDAICDIAPEPLGDSVVDTQDLVQLAKYLNMAPPVDYWQFDEAEGIIAHDFIGVKDAVVHSDATWQPDGGKIGGALLFDGADDYVSTPFILDPAEDSFSVFAWIKGGASGQVVISQADSYIETPRAPITRPGCIWLGIDSPNDQLMTGLMHPPFSPLVSEIVITDGQWHHVGLVYDYSVLKRYLFVDGIEVAKDTDYVGGLGSDAVLYIGVGPALEETTFFSGLIDDVRIYNKVLSKEAIASLAH
jgi:hypothetical protein